MAPRRIEWRWPPLNQGVSYKDKIRGQKGGAGSTLLEYYASNYGESAPVEGWQARIRGGQVSVDGVVVTDGGTPLRAGARLEYLRRPWAEPDAPCHLDILHEDEDILVVNKPSGLQVLPGGGFQQRTALTLLRRWHAAQGGGDGEGTGGTGRPDGRRMEPVPVHRLGRGTSGVLLCARTVNARRALSEDFLAKSGEVVAALVSRGHSAEEADAAGGKMVKTYRALAAGVIKEDRLAIHTPIGKMPWPGVAGGLFAASTEEDGKQSFSVVRVLRRDEGATLVEVDLHTGRPHQIRIHLASAGHPLVGDPLYASGGRPKPNTPKDGDAGAQLEPDGSVAREETLPGEGGFLLHAHRLALWHPTSKKLLTVEAPPPPELGEPGDRQG